MKNYMHFFMHLSGRAMAQVVNHQPFTLEARFQSIASSCGVCGGQNGSRAGSSSKYSYLYAGSIVTPTTFHTHSYIYL